jgi:hypothetical protein
MRNLISVWTFKHLARLLLWLRPDLAIVKAKGGPYGDVVTIPHEGQIR